MFGFFGRDGRTVIADLDHDGFIAVARSPHHDLSVGMVGADGLYGIFQQVEYDLSDQVFVGIQNQVVRADIGLYGDMGSMVVAGSINLPT